MRAPILTVALLLGGTLWANGSSNGQGGDDEGKGKKGNVQHHIHHWSQTPSYPRWNKDEEWHPYHKRAPYSKRSHDDESSSDDSHSSKHSSKLPGPVGTDHYGIKPPSEMTWGTDEHGVWDNGVEVSPSSDPGKGKGHYKGGGRSRGKHHGKSGYGLPSEGKGYYGDPGKTPRFEHSSPYGRPIGIGADRTDRIDPHVSVDAGEGRDDTFTPIDVHKRGFDWASAFDRILDVDDGGKAYAIVDGSRVNHIVDMQPLPNGSLVALIIDHRNREERKVVKAEDIEFVGQMKKKRSPVRYPDRW